MKKDNTALSLIMVSWFKLYHLAQLTLVFKLKKRKFKLKLFHSLTIYRLIGQTRVDSL